MADAPNASLKRIHSWLRRRWAWLALGLFLFLIYGAPLGRHISNSASSLNFNDDVRQQIYPFYRYTDGKLFQNDYVSDYYLDCLPVGYRALYTVGAAIGDAETLSKILPYFLFFLSVLAIGATAARFGGVIAAGVAMALMLGSELYLSRIVGGLPRAFGFPLIALAMLALVNGRIKWLPPLVLVAAGFYPVVAVILGFTLALVLLVLPRADRGSARRWSFRRRLVVLSITAVGAGLLLLPTILSTGKYGPVIRPADIKTYPEAGPFGRYGKKSLLTGNGFFKVAPHIVEAAVIGHGSPWFNATRRLVENKSSRALVLIVIILLALLGWIRLLFHQSRARRLLTLFFAAFTGMLISQVAIPYLYLPERYVMYTLPLLITVMIATSSVGLWSLVKWRPGRAWLQPVLAGAFYLLLLLIAGGQGEPRTGLSLRIPPNLKIFDEIAALPPNVVLAGWPSGLIDNVPYFSRRTAFIAFETHQAFHGAYVIEMRKRMRALIEAYFATSPGSLLRLRNKFGVTHLIVDLRYLLGKRPHYFQPFVPLIMKMMVPGRGQSFELLRQLKGTAIFKEGPFRIIDLARLKSTD